MRTITLSNSQFGLISAALQYVGFKELASDLNLGKLDTIIQCDECREKTKIGGQSPDYVLCEKCSKCCPECGSSNVEPDDDDGGIGCYDCGEWFWEVEKK